MYIWTHLNFINSEVLALGIYIVGHKRERERETTPTEHVSSVQISKADTGKAKKKKRTHCLERMSS